jgi:adenosine deaminase
MIKRYLTFLLICISLNINAQTVDHYFQHIRNNPAKLTAFFAEMPKGGDLHHHYSGSVYAESYIRWVIEKDYFINKRTLEVAEKAPNRDTMWKSFSQLAKSKQLDSIKFVLIQKWSVKDYNGISYPSDKLFFDTFSYFGVASRLNLDSGLLEIKKRAEAEHVSYIETMFSTVSSSVNTADLSTLFNPQLEDLQTHRNAAETQKLLADLYTRLIGRNIIPDADRFCADVARLHNSLRIDDNAFTMRYQTYVVRVVPATDVFKSLVLAFEAANRSPLIVGVNIVAPENNEVSMRDYWLHMQMFRFCHVKYPRVKIAMHAGELCLGMVQPEELTWHIGAAVYTAGAQRIGHGVDMPYERNAYSLMTYMRQKHIAVEINLYSNEFILKVKGDRHPVTLYKEFGVPIVICTDDAGVLRSDLTEQYVLLAGRYPAFSYSDIKKIVYNSIYYAFIEEPSVSKKLTDGLNRDFARFEKKILAFSK